MLCTLAGLPVYTVISDEMAHSWNVVLTEDAPLYIDCTFDDANGAVSHTYFLLTEAALSEDHTWDTAFYAALFAYLVH
jgi:transglutaminase/protease-like cytokinesis protein 3